MILNQHPPRRSVAVRRRRGGGGGCVNNLCISLSEEEQTSDGVGRRRKVFVMPGENQGIEVHIVKQCFRQRPTARDDYNAREHIDDESVRVDRVQA